MQLSTPRLRFFLIRSSFVGLLLVINCDLAWAQKGANSRDERRENQRVAAAEKTLSEVKKELASIQNDLKREMGHLEKGEASLIQLRKAVRQAKEDAEDRLGDKLGIPKALQAVRSARETLDKASANVIASLANDASWKEAKPLADAARQIKKTLNEDVELDDEERELKLREANAQIAKLDAIEQEAIAKDPAAIKAKEGMLASQNELDTLRKKLPKDKIESDPKVVQLNRDIEKKEKELNNFKNAIAKLRMEASKTQRRFSQATMSLRNAKAADAADSNRNKKK